MPIFRPRNRTEILRDMIARVVARSRLSRVRKNGGVYHVLSAAASEDAEQYFQMARLREIFSIDKATGSDLDERATEIATDESLDRIKATKATTLIQYTRAGTTGTTTIPKDYVVAASDTQGDIFFKTTAAGSIAPGDTTSGLIPVIALIAGSRANVDVGAIKKITTRIAGVISVTNPAKVNNGLDRESDQDYRRRLKAHVQSLSRGTLFAVETAVRSVSLSTGQRVRFAKLVEPVFPDGTYSIYIDDGTGAVDTYSEVYITAFDTLVSSASGGEVRVRTSQRPIRNDESFALYLNGVLVSPSSYEINLSTGEIELSTALTAGQNLKANYRYYTGLIQEAQKVVDGDKNDRQNYPGYKGGGYTAYVLPPQRVLQTVEGSLTIEDDYDVDTVTQLAIDAAQEYINTLDIGESVLIAQLITKVCSVAGVKDFKLTSPTANQVVLPNQVARIFSSSISIV